MESLRLSDILSQAEIEALLNSLGGDNGGASAGSSAAGGNKGGGPGPSKQNPAGSKRMTKAPVVAYEIYDFRRPDKLSKDQLRTLQMLHETFARQVGSALSAQLRIPVAVEMISIEQVPYDEYLRSINQSVFAVMSLPPLNGQAVLEIEFGQVFAMVDRMLGGPGRPLNRGVLTDIERPLVKQVVEKMFGALKQAWESVVVVNPTIDGIETSAQFVTIAPPNDIVLTILFEVKLGELRTAMSLCIPYLVLKPITTKLSAQKWFASSGRKHSPASRRLLSTQIGNSNVECTIRLGKAKILFGEFMNLKVGDIVRLDQRTAHDLPFLVGDIAKFQGRPLLHGKRLVFSVSQPFQR